MTPQEIENKITQQFDKLVMDLSPEEYREALESVIDSLEIRLEAVKEENDWL